MRYHAAYALGNIKSKETIPYLIDALSDQHWIVRRNAVQALGDIGIKTEIVVLNLKRLELNDPHKEVQKAAKESLSKITASFNKNDEYEWKSILDSE